jgi:hypothetical protein
MMAYCSPQRLLLSIGRCGTFFSKTKCQKTYEIRTHGYELDLLTFVDRPEEVFPRQPLLQQPFRRAVQYVSIIHRARYDA